MTSRRSSPTSTSTTPKSRSEREGNLVKILGVDPGSRTTGYALLEAGTSSLRFIEAGIFATARSAGFPARLAEIGRALEEVLARCQPEQTAVEDLFHAVGARSALKLAHARGVILGVIARAGLPIAEYTPLQVKKAVSGYGLAEKDALRVLVERMLAIPSGILTRDAADAVAVALCHAQALPFSRAVSAADRGRPRAAAAAGGRAGVRKGGSQVSGRDADEGQLAIRAKRSAPARAPRPDAARLGAARHKSGGIS